MWLPKLWPSSSALGAGRRVSPGAGGWWAGLTSQQFRLSAAVDQQAELQHQLRRAAQEGLQQTQHAHVRALEQHPPVEVAPQPLPAPAALQPQVQGAQVPAGEVALGSRLHRLCVFPTPVSRLCEPVQYPTSGPTLAVK